MLYWLAQVLEQHIHAFRVFHYISFRSIAAAVCALLFSLFTGPTMIRRLQQLSIGQQVRDDGPQTHLVKSGTPTMGGLLMIAAITFMTLLFSDLRNQYSWIMLFITLGFAWIGGIDDYRKMVKKNSKGLSARGKLIGQVSLSIIVSSYLYFYAHGPSEHILMVPFFKTVIIPLGAMWILFAVLVITGTSNAVNLTDGLDGLAIMPVVMVASALGIFAYVTGNVEYASYLSLPYVSGVGEVAIFMAAIAGAGLGFLWFNAYPAEVFMGDVGSLSLGAALGVAALLVHQELVLFLMGGIFVAETLSVIIQVGYFKMTRKRVFLMAPLHHHFELKGWPEPKVIVRFWIITLMFVLLGLATLKLR